MAPLGAATMRRTTDVLGEHGMEEKMWITHTRTSTRILGGPAQCIVNRWKGRRADEHRLTVEEERCGYVLGFKELYWLG